MENGKTALGDAAIVETVWIVQKLDWLYNDCWYTPQDDAPVKAFIDRTLAQKYADVLTVYEQAKWAESMGHHSNTEGDLSDIFGGLSRMTTLSEDEFINRIKEAGLAGPRFYEDFNSGSWWGRVWKTLPENKRGWFWSLFDLIQFYEVVEVELLP